MLVNERHFQQILVYALFLLCLSPEIRNFSLLIVFLVTNDETVQIFVFSFLNFNIDFSILIGITKHVLEIMSILDLDFFLFHVQKRHFDTILLFLGELLHLILQQQKRLFSFFDLKTLLLVFIMQSDFHFLLIIIKKFNFSIYNVRFNSKNTKHERENSRKTQRDQ